MLLLRLSLRFLLLLDWGLLLHLWFLLAKHIGETELADPVAVRDIALRATRITLSFEEVIFDRFLLLL
jgi:hypothetical protein